MICDNTKHSAPAVPESLKLLQGPGVNGLFQTAAPLSWEYDESSKTATYVLNKDYTLHIQNYPSKNPGIPPLKPETYKLLDILVCKLGESNVSRQVELPFEEFMRLGGYAVTTTNKDAVRRKLKESVALLGALSADWTEENGRYSHHNIKFFAEIFCRNSRIYACFGERMTLYLRGGCSPMPLPLSLLRISGKSPHSYLLGRRCLVHNASNKGREWQPIRVGNLLAVCPRIHRPKPEEKWSPSILARNVISPFTMTMNTLADRGILAWEFREPVCRGDYEGFFNSIIDFRVTQTPSAVVLASPAESEEEFSYDKFDNKWFQALA